MIVSYNVCDHCGAQTEITEAEGSECKDCFEFNYYVVNVVALCKGAKNNFPKWVGFTFCNRDCLIEYLKQNMDNDGTIKRREQ